MKSGRRVGLSALVVGFALAQVAAAADVSGKWRAEFTTPDGTQPLSNGFEIADVTIDRVLPGIGETG